jgi:protein gp37
VAENSKIEWTDHTFNPWIGCAKVHAGCLNCYAERDQDKRRHRAKWGVHGTRSLTSPGNWKLPHKWNREAAAAGRPARVFCASLADVFEDRPDLVDWRRDLFHLVDETPNLIWLMLTKRPENVPAMWRGMWKPNIWVGTSPCNQETAEASIPELLNCAYLCGGTFLSCEPLIGPIELSPWLSKIGWVIAGGESGPSARPVHPDWIRNIREQCIEAGVPFFFKQWGEWVPAIAAHGFVGGIMPESGRIPGGTPVTWIGWDGTLACPSARDLRDPTMAIARAGKKSAGRMLDGREWSQLPEAFTPAEVAV